MADGQGSNPLHPIFFITPAKKNRFIGTETLKYVQFVTQMM